MALANYSRVLLLDIEHITEYLKKRGESMGVKITSEEIKEHYYFYDVKIKKMGDYTEITQYSEKLRALKKGAVSPYQNKLKDLKRKNKGDGVIRDDSLNRSFGRLMDLSLTNHDIFTTFITLTFAENITDLDYANKKFHAWTSNVRKVFPGFKYLGVPEFQKRGAVHYHLMTNLNLDSDIIVVQENHENMYDVKYWPHGFSSVFDLTLTDDDFSVALYLSKYFYKDIDNRLLGRRNISASQNLKEPDIYKFESDEVEKINKFIEGKKKVKEKSITPASEYAPNLILISTYK